MIYGGISFEAEMTREQAEDLARLTDERRLEPEVRTFDVYALG